MQFFAKLILGAILGTIKDAIFEYFELQRTRREAVLAHEKDKQEQVNEIQKRVDAVPDGTAQSTSDSLRDGTF